MTVMYTVVGWALAHGELQLIVGIHSDCNLKKGVALFSF
jgi:hypothetical protein